MKKITGRYYSFSTEVKDGMVDLIEHYEPEKMNDLFVGRRIVAVDEDHLELDDGTVVRVVPNEGGCACSAGDYYLDRLNLVSNLITRVEVEARPGGDGVPCRTCGAEYCYGKEGHESGYEGWYRIFVWSHDERLELANITGSDGNGYYGTGFDLLVRRPVIEGSAELIEESDL
jgi:hypothetical protein